LGEGELTVVLFMSAQPQTGGEHHDNNDFELDEESHTSDNEDKVRPVQFGKVLLLPPLPSSSSLFFKSFSKSNLELKAY